MGETASVGEECSSSISQTFQVPVAAAYYRTFWPRFALIEEDVGHCGGMVQDMATLGTGKKIKSKSGADARQAAAAFAKSIDKDGDGKLSEDEIKALNKGERNLLELVSFHDTDKDGVVTIIDPVPHTLDCQRGVW